MEQMEENEMKMMTTQNPRSGWLLKHIYHTDTRELQMNRTRNYKSVTRLQRKYWMTAQWMTQRWMAAMMPKITEVMI